MPVSERHNGGHGPGALLDEIKTLALKAGDAILEVYSSADFGTTFKEEGSPLTLADKASHSIITDGLSRISPGMPVLSEESEAAPYEVRKAWERFWLIDPLDGTKEFIKRNGEFTVNIALIAGNAPVMGVVYAPVLRVMYYASSGAGAFKDTDGATARISASDYRGAMLKVVGSRSHGGEELSRFIERIGQAEFLSMGSSLKLCLVAEGAAHLYPRFGPTMEWDTAAAQCVVEEAGGTVTDLKGQRLCYNKKELKNPFFMISGKPPFPWQGILA
ncbi:MAG: 3'(2'),5'-bisphosphate nucleotidase CysQ [Deltaproteobacteria bacterium]|nr:3'(2'),5'-bisphosphate nucleotidase CysQ [Deltaproteobacteria bacterium]